MKNYVRFFLTLGASIFALNCNAQSSQSNLPPCQGANTNAWSQCAGTKNYPNGDMYVGDWIGGKASGQGTYTSKASGAMYAGQFAADTFSGAGTMTWTNGAKFVGQWKNDSAVSGTITYANGSTAVGTVKAAVFYAAAQQPQVVAAKQPQAQAPHQPISQSKLPPCPTGANLPPWHMCFGNWSDGAGNSYSGEYRAGVPHGQGVLIAADGSSQSGEFADGVFQKGDYKQPDPRIASQNQVVTAQRQSTPQQNSSPAPAQGLLAQAQQWTTANKEMVYLTLLTSDGIDGLRPHEDKAIRDYIMKMWGTHTKGEYGDVEQRRVHRVGYLGMNRYPRKYNDYAYATYQINMEVFILGSQGNIKKVTSYAVELDAIFVGSGNFDYKWTWK